MAIPRDPGRRVGRLPRVTGDEPASVLAARQLAAEAAGAPGGRRAARRARAVGPIRPLTNRCPLAS